MARCLVWRVLTTWLMMRILWTGSLCLICSSLTPGDLCWWVWCWWCCSSSVVRGRSHSTRVTSSRSPLLHHHSDPMTALSSSVSPTYSPPSSVWCSGTSLAGGFCCWCPRLGWVSPCWLLLRIFTPLLNNHQLVSTIWMISHSVIALTMWYHTQSITLTMWYHTIITTTVPGCCCQCCRCSHSSTTLVWAVSSGLWPRRFFLPGEIVIYFAGKSRTCLQSMVVENY